MRNYFFDLSPLAIAYFSSLLFLGNTDQAIAVLLAVAVHEVSHLVSLTFFNCSVSSLTVSLNGLCIKYSGNETPQEVFFSNMAGPLGGFLFFLFARLCSNRVLPDWFFMSAKISLFFSLFNSMPVCPLDGGYALDILLAAHLEHDERERIIKFFGVCFSVLLIFIGLMCIMKGRGFGASAAGVWILCANITTEDL